MIPATEILSLIRTLESLYLKLETLVTPMLALYPRDLLMQLM